MNRRSLLRSLPLGLLVFGCSPTTPGATSVPMNMLKAYGDDVINALSAAAQAYVVSPGAKNTAIVNQIVGYLQSTKDALDSVQIESDARGIALEVVGFAQQLSPIVAPFLGPAAPFVPIALAVLQAFIASLPPPPAAPPTPPAALHNLALKYRHPR